jgi:hypothetical protein
VTTVPHSAGSTIASILVRDPARHPLVNQGQARIDGAADGRVLAELRGELETFVCEGQYGDGLGRILGAYLASLGQTSQKGAWVSGFFGSGKSHLLKMLCHLWANTAFPDGRVARDIVPTLPEDLRALLREIDTAGRRAGGLLACAGTMPSGNTDRVRLTILSVLLRAVGLPEQWPKAQFCLWLHERGWLDQVRAAVEAAGKRWEAELDNLHVSDPIPRALLACDPSLAAAPADVRKLLASQFPVRSSDLSTPEFLTACRRALALVGRDGRLPCTLLVLDEVQQFIGDSNDRSVLVTEAIEALSKQFDSQLMVVAAGQSALTAVPLLAKLMDRCTIRVPLSDADVEAVTRKVLLQKQPAALPRLRALLDAHAGELSRQLQGTRIGEHATDRAIAADDYPLTPVRRRFWELCFRQVDAAGTSSQLRSQLRIIHDAIARLADRPLGALVPGDELFDALAPEMVNTGVLLRELNERIIALDRDGSASGRLQRRLAGLVFLIARLPRDAAVDSGVRASPAHLADLIVDDLAADNARLRKDVESALEVMATAGVLMRIGDEYRLQTRAGADWDREFRTRQARLGGDEAAIQLRRDDLLATEFARALAGLRIRQGASKEPRTPSVVRDAVPPRPGGDQVPLWVRDGWSADPKDVVDALRAAGGDSPLVGVVLPRASAEDLRRSLIDADAAQQTIDAKPVAPDDGEGREAKKGMESRRDLACAQRDRLIAEIVQAAKVYQAGGSELLHPTLDEKLRAAIDAALARLFPRFREADAPAAAWETAIRRAREGGDQPLQPLGHTGATETHPVCPQVLAAVGAGAIGADLRRSLGGAPYGWPQDAIDAALIALHRSQHLGVLLNGTPLPPGQLDQAKLGKAEFRVERHVLGVSDRLALRKLFQASGLTCKGGDEIAVAPAFVARLAALASSAGGEPPLPAAPDTGVLADLSGRIGTDLLAALRERADALGRAIADWGRLQELVAARLPAWRLVERLLRHVADLPGASAACNQAEAIRAGRLLLAATDPVPAVRAALAEALRGAVAAAHSAHAQAALVGAAALAASPDWQRLDAPRQAAVLAEVGLGRAPTAPDLPDDAALLAALDARPLLARQADGCSAPWPWLRVCSNPACARWRSNAPPSQPLRTSTPGSRASSGCCSPPSPTVRWW